MKSVFKFNLQIKTYIENAKKNATFLSFNISEK